MRLAICDGDRLGPLSESVDISEKLNNRLRKINVESSVGGNVVVHLSTEGRSESDVHIDPIPTGYKMLCGADTRMRNRVH